MARALVAACALLLSSAAALPGCFHPDKPSCAFSCVEPPHTCPSGFTCGGDGLCHDPTSARVCTIEPIDAATVDGQSNDRDASAGDAVASSDVARGVDALDAATDRGQ
jgi:hypothetical protein